MKSMRATQTDIASRQQVFGNLRIIGTALLLLLTVFWGTFRENSRETASLEAATGQRLLPAASFKAGSGAMPGLEQQRAPLLDEVLQRDFQVMKRTEVHEWDNMG